MSGHCFCLWISWCPCNKQTPGIDLQAIMGIILSLSIKSVLLLVKLCTQDITSAVRTIIENMRLKKADKSQQTT